MCEACGLLLGANLAPQEQSSEQLRRLLDAPITQLQLLSSHAQWPNGGTPPGLSKPLDAATLRQL